MIAFLFAPKLVQHLPELDELGVDRKFRLQVVPQFLPELGQLNARRGGVVLLGRVLVDVAAQRIETLAIFRPEVCLSAAGRQLAAERSAIMAAIMAPHPWDELMCNATLPIAS